MKTLSILGSTGSIGSQTLDVISRNRNDFTLKYLTTNSRIDILEKQIQTYSPISVAIANEKAYKEFCQSTTFKGTILCGDEGIIQAASDNNDIVMSSLVGFSGVFPTLAAIRAGSTIALANKETLVSAGEIIMKEAHIHNTSLLAVDSEHSAILQSIVGENIEDIEKIILTASGGPFRTMDKNLFSTIKPENALKHPTWKMGAKITIDSATLMNKGLELIEARWLFDLKADKLDVVVHPQSIIHSMIEFVDGSIKAQLSVPDMKLPIQYAMTYPERICANFVSNNFPLIGTLNFFAPDKEKFDCLAIAYDALEAGGTAPCIVNAANEIAVQKFLDKEIGFTGIPALIRKCLDKIAVEKSPDLPTVYETDKKTRELALSLH